MTENIITETRPSIYGLTRDQLIEWAIENGEKKFRATQDRKSVV